LTLLHTLYLLFFFNILFSFNVKIFILQWKAASKNPDGDVKQYYDAANVKRIEYLKLKQIFDEGPLAKFKQGALLQKMASTMKEGQHTSSEEESDDSEGESDSDSGDEEDNRVKKKRKTNSQPEVNKPMRAKSAYLYFSMEFRRKAKEAAKAAIASGAPAAPATGRNVALSKQMKSEYNALTESGKQKYLTLSAADAIRHQNETIKYNAYLASQEKTSNGTDSIQSSTSSTSSTSSSSSAAVEGISGNVEIVLEETISQLNAQPLDNSIIQGVSNESSETLTTDSSMGGMMQGGEE